MVFVSSAPRYGFDATVCKVCPCTVTTLLEQLELPPLSTRRKISCITLLHKAIHEKVAIPIPSYIIKPTNFEIPSSEEIHTNVLLGVGPSQSVEYVFGDEGPNAGILKVKSDKRKVCLFLYLLWT
jgi:hypothetical protein